MVVLYIHHTALLLAASSYEDRLGRLVLHLVSDCNLKVDARDSGDYGVTIHAGFRVPRASSLDEPTAVPSSSADSQRERKLYIRWMIDIILSILRIRGIR